MAETPLKYEPGGLGRKSQKAQNEEAEAEAARAKACAPAERRPTYTSTEEKMHAAEMILKNTFPNDPRHDAALRALAKIAEGENATMSRIGAN